VNPTEHSMKTWDGVELLYRAWPSPKPTSKGLLLFHRGHEDVDAFVRHVTQTHQARWPLFGPTSPTTT
jgi:alpha-beta hydrolase superfamily lysophospholipase